MLVEKIFKSWIGTYTLKCPECRQDMKLLSTAEEQKFESPKTATEVEAGGKDFEYWKCTQCNHSEQFEVVLPEGLVCPKCGWYSVKRTKKDIPEKNMIQISDKCLNPKCTYTSEQTKKLQDSSDAETFLNVALTVGSIALDVASSSSSGSGFSGGGGSFGGGGSSGSW